MKPLMAAAAVEAPDEQLVAAARAGSDTAFEALFRRYRDRITGYVRGIVSDHGRAEDIVQDVFISAHRHLMASDRELAFKPWIYEIAKNACIDQLRRARRTSEVSIDSDDFSDRDEGRLSAGLSGTDAQVSRREELDSLKMAFNELPDQQHEILVMRELEGLSYDGISARMGLSRSAVESMLFRARRRLKDEFDDISTGERCIRTQAVLAKLSEGRIGMRAERRLEGHLRDCAGCRREAVAMGLDELALGAATRRARSGFSRAAAFLPLPAFLRRRWAEGLHGLGAAGSSGAEQGASLAAKAIAVVAAAALVGGGAGVVHKAAGDSSKAAPGAGSKHGVGSGGSGSGPPAQGRGAGGGRGGSGSGDSRGPGAGGGSHGGSGSAGQGSTPSSAGGDLGGKGALGQSLQGAGGTVQGAGGKAGSIANGLGGGTSDSLDSTVQGITKDTGQVVQQVGTDTGTGNTVKSVKDTAGSALQTVGGTVESAPTTTLPNAQSTVNQVTSTLPKTTTTPSVDLPSANLGL